MASFRRLPPALLLFDGTCALCNHSARFVLKCTQRLSRDVLCVAELQNDAVVKAVKAQAGVDLTRFRDCQTIVLLQCQPGREAVNQVTVPASPDLNAVDDVSVSVSTKSAAVFKTAMLCDWRAGRWLARLAYAVVPTLVGDAVYDFVGRYRIAWFGRVNDAGVCVRPPPEFRARIWRP